MLDIAVGILDYYLQYGTEVGRSRALLQQQLLAAGFSQQQLERIIDWVADLATLQQLLQTKKPFKSGTRVYTRKERQRLSTECLSVLLSLEQMDLLPDSVRETVIHQAMTLEGGPVKVEQLKALLAIALFYQPGLKKLLANLQQ